MATLEEKKQDIVLIKTLEGYSEQEANAYADNFLAKQAGTTATPIREGNNILASLLSNAGEALVTRPVARTTEAVTRLAFPNSEAARGYEALADAGESQSILGTEVSPVNAFGQGGGRQIAGEILETASYLPAGRALGTATRTIANPTLRNVGVAGLEGALGGVLGSTGTQLQDGEVNFGQVAQDTAIGGAFGAGLGGVGAGAGAGARAITRGVDSTKKSLSELMQGARARLTPNVPENISQPEVFSRAVSRGFAPQEARVFSELTPTDKPIAREMLQLAEDVDSGAASLGDRRPIDLVGEQLQKEAQKLQEITSRLGSRVDEVAQSLKGQDIDTAPLVTQIEDTLGSYGINLTKTKDGGIKSINFQDSDFALTDNVQSDITKALNYIYSGKKDAYSVHRIKKVLDTLVQPTKQGDGLAGQAKRLVQTLRRNTDDFLDTRFDDYNVANTEFKEAIDVSSNFQDVFGGTEESRLAQRLRSIYSNSVKRTELKDAIKQLNDYLTSKGESSGVNTSTLTELAERLEDIYGTQAITGLRGQTERAIQGVRAVSEGLRDPIRGAGNVAASVVERVARQRPQDRLKFMKDLLRSTDEVTPTNFNPAETALVSQVDEPILNNLNPTGTIFTEYSPSNRAEMKLGENITTLDKTSNKSPDDIITVYRGTSNPNSEIIAGDFITTNKQLAKDYAGNGVVISRQVKMKDVLDDITEPLGEEYIYRPN